MSERKGSKILLKTLEGDRACPAPSWRLVFGKSQYDMRNIIKAHEISEQSMRTQIENLKSFHAKELELRDEAIEKYQAELQALEEQYEIRLVEIETLTKEEKAIIIKEFTEDKEALIQRFIDTYGLYYVQ